MSEPLILNHTLSFLFGSENSPIESSDPYSSDHYAEEDKEDTTETELALEQQVEPHDLEQVREILKLRLVCKSWKKVIDSSYMTQIVVPYLKTRLQEQEQNVMVGTNFLCFRIPVSLLYLFAFFPRDFGDEFLEATWDTEHRELGKFVNRVGTIVSLYTCGATIMFLKGNPVVLSVVVAGIVVDNAIGKILEYRNKKKLANNQQILSDMERNIKYENSLIRNCEIISTVPDQNNSKNKHSCLMSYK